MPRAAHVPDRQRALGRVDGDDTDALDRGRVRGRGDGRGRGGHDLADVGHDAPAAVDAIAEHDLVARTEPRQRGEAFSFDDEHGVPAVGTDGDRPAGRVDANDVRVDERRYRRVGAGWRVDLGLLRVGHAGKCQDGKDGDDSLHGSGPPRDGKQR